MSGAARLFVLAVTVAVAAAAAADDLPAVHITRAAGAIAVDGDLSDEAWKSAAVVDTFYEVRPGNNTTPGVRTVAYLTYDADSLYVAVHCADPRPEKIRAAYVERDQVLRTEDNVALFLDTRADGRSAIELRVNPRGVQGDAIYNDANDLEDFSPDFYYDSAARITGEGWDAELRIPFSSLRYSDTAPAWRLLLWRNYPREVRYAFHSSPHGRGSSCMICEFRPLVGFENIPPPGHVTAAPHVRAQHDALPGEETHIDGGFDVKWTPPNDVTLDATFNPDFSQVEADVAQISVNERFALSYPEKRAFFLESTDLLQTPVPVVYTRTITQPRWGFRGTAKSGRTAYTLLVARDQGGGQLVLPGPEGSRLVPQAFRSTALIGRARRDFGRSFAGLTVTAREVDGGGYNRVIGTDFQWRHRADDIVTGQFLYSSTANPERPDLDVRFDGRRSASHAVFLNWYHQTTNVDWTARVRDFGEGFRADNGFVPQTGFREGYGNFGLRFYPTGRFLNYVRPSVSALYDRNESGQTLFRGVTPAVNAIGRRYFQGVLGLHVDDAVRTRGPLLHESYLTYSFQIDPSRRFVTFALDGRLGEAIDVTNAREGRGGTAAFQATLRPSDRLELKATSSLQWLDVDAGDVSGRVFTAQVQRLKVTASWTTRSILRLIAQYQDTERNPALYRTEVARHSGRFDASILYSYKVNWQTVVYIGYGDERVLDAADTLTRTAATTFAKISYAFQR